jgi:DNA polymerase III delta' subunit
MKLSDAHGMTDYFWQQAARTQFLQRLRADLPHALLITSPAGLGAYDFAVSIANQLICLQNGELACGVCRACVALAAGSHPDFWQAGLLDEKKSIGVDQIRELSASLSMRPQAGKRQVALIWPAEAMTVAAANALLKTLEEPSADTVLLLVSEQPGSLLPTINSRCQRIALRVPDTHASVQWLLNQGKFAASDIDLALQISAGAPLAALDLLHQNGLAQIAPWRQMLGQAKHADAMALGRTLATQADAFLRFYEFELRRTMPMYAHDDQRLLAVATLRKQAQRIADLQGTGVRIDLAFAELLMNHWQTLPRI